MHIEEMPGGSLATAKGAGTPGSTFTTLIDRKTLLSMIPLAERTIFDMEQRGEFPHRISLTVRRVAWDLTKVEEWIESRRAAGVQAARPGIAQLADRTR